MHSSLIIQFKPWIPLVLSWHGVTVLTSLESQNSHWIYHPKARHIGKWIGIPQIWLIMPLLSLFTLGILVISKYQHQNPRVTRFFCFPSSLSYHHQRTNTVIMWKTALLTLHTIHSQRSSARIVFPPCTHKLQSYAPSDTVGQGSTCEETWFQMLSARKAISPHQHCQKPNKPPLFKSPGVLFPFLFSLSPPPLRRKVLNPLR